MPLTNDQLQQILLNALDELKNEVKGQTFSDKVVDGVAMILMPITPARPELPAGAVMLAISEKHGLIDEIREAFNSWGTDSSYRER